VGLSGTVELEEPSIADEILLELTDRKGASLFKTMLSSEGKFSLRDWSGPDAVILHASAAGHRMERVYTQRRRQDVRLQLRRAVEAGLLEWRLAGSESDPAPRNASVRLYRVTDPRIETMGTAWQEFFEGVMSSAGWPIAAISRHELVGEPVGDGSFAYRLSPVPAGELLFYIASQGGGDHARRISMPAGGSEDLGLIELSAAHLDIAVCDKSSGQPIVGGRSASSGWRDGVGEASVSDAYGMARMSGFVGTQVRASASGYHTADLSLVGADPSEERIRLGLPTNCDRLLLLEPADTWTLRLSPGTWVMIRSMHESGRSRAHARVVPESGELLVPVTDMGQIFCYDPMEQRYWSRPIRNKRPVMGKASIELHASGAVERLEWGSVSLRSRSRGLRFVAGLHEGVARLDQIPVGHYSLVLRPGALVHDNDHEFWLKDLYLGTEKVVQRVRLPESELRIRVENGNGQPLAKQLVTLRMTVPETASFRRVRVSIQAMTDLSGELRFRWLPQGLCRVRVGASEFRLQCSSKLQTLTLP
jgi:hypothetical protein